MLKYVILIPCYNDWKCLNLLIPQIDEVLTNIQNKLSILVINDGSSIKNNLVFNNLKNIKKVDVLNLKRNVKAQIAIATGLEYLKNINYQGGIIVMDADGQDDPDVIKKIINSSANDEEDTITVNRTKREDDLFFKFFYQIYLLLTYILTFKYMKFGVFSYIHSNSLSKILSTNDINLAYAGSLAKHFKNKKKIKAPRKKRLIDKSKNNYLNLITYALKIISIFKYRVLFNSIILFIIFLPLTNNIISSLASYLFIFVILFFNTILFYLSYKITSKGNDRLSNIYNVDELKK